MTRKRLEGHVACEALGDEKGGKGGGTGWFDACGPGLVWRRQIDEFDFDAHDC